MTRSYVSRLEAVKKAALHQIKQIKDETPNVRVGFVTFGSEVSIVSLAWGIKLWRAAKLRK